LSTFSDSVALSRNAVAKIQDLDTLYGQSDYSTKFKAWNMQHEVLTGVDFAQEHKNVYAVRTAAQGGVTLAGPNTTIGSPDDGASINEGARVLRPNNDYDSLGWGVYAQDLVQVAPHWKLLAGLRFDKLYGNYNTYGLNAANQVITTGSYQMKVAALSKRAGVIFQPNELDSFHFSIGSSFNTSGDAYSLGATTKDVPPESSLNIELGAKLDSADKRFTTRLALFQSVKYHERNTDPLNNNAVVLSGKRHATGFEVDFSGQLTPKWEMYGSYMWMPEANIDIGAAGAEGQGTRPSLTPYHTGTLWNTYQLDPQWRVGIGFNIRGRQTPLRNPGFEVPGFVTTDLMAEYKYSEKFTVKANISNVTNALYADQLYTSFYVPGPGRLLQVTASMKF
jgi:catecholate siderophore receptor